MSSLTRFFQSPGAPVAYLLAATLAAEAPEHRPFRPLPAVALPEDSRDQGQEPLSLASADFDGDGLPDAVAGFADLRQGVLRLYRGNADALHPNTGDARRRRAEGTSSDAPLLATPIEMTVTERPDSLFAGDFNADGHADLIAGALGGSTLHLFTGDGSGSFHAEERIVLPAPITALGLGEIDRADGLPDLIAAVGGRTARVILFHGPEGAMRATPEILSIPAEASAVAAGDIDEDGYRDVAIAAESSLWTVSGRPGTQRVLILRASLGGVVSAMSVGRFGSAGRVGIRLAGPSGVRTLDREPDETASGAFVWKSTDWELETGAFRLPATVLAAREAGVESRDLSDLDAAAVLPLRVNSHAAPGLLVLGSTGTLSVLAPAAGATLVVNTTATTDVRDDLLSLREAIQIANGTLAFASLTDAEKARVSGTPAKPGLDAIEFDIPGGGVPVIAAAPPPATDAVTIDGTSQPGGRVQITPPGSSSATILTIKGGSSLVRGLVLNGQGNGGIFLDSSDNVVEGNFIGTNADGTASTGLPGVAGVRVVSGANNRIGGTAAAARNVISGINGDGIHQVGGTDLLVQGNFIGTNAAGTGDLGNAGEGIYLFGGSDATIGGTTAGAGNVVSGNGSSGIWIQTTGNLVQGNRCGTDVTGTLPLGNTASGILSYFNAGPNTIGGTAAGSGNLSSGNGADGIQLSNNAPADIVVRGNRVGTNAAGTTAVPNAGSGLHLVGISGTTIGGAGVGARNLISGNGLDGIFFDRFVNIMSTTNTVHGNFIGTDVTGTVPIANLRNGVNLSYSEKNLIGGVAAGEGNLISGNFQNGIWIERLVPPANADRILGNLIGTNVLATGALGNGESGVSFRGNTSGHQVGGAGPGEANTIAYNAGPGLSANFSSGLHVAPNRTFGNGGLGLDLLDDGLTANRPGAYDNFPVLTAAVRSAAGTTIQGSLSARASTTFDIHFFSNPSCDPSGHGEGREYIGQTSVTTDAAGNVTFSKLFTPAVPGGQYITAFAVAPTGTYPEITSEFSFCRLVEGDPGPPAGTPISLAVVVPSGGGNTALTTVRITGEGILEGAAVKLVRAGLPDIAAVYVLVDPAGGNLAAVLPLQNQVLGIWDVVVTNPGGGSATLPQAFEIRAGSGPKIWSQLLGPGRIVRGYPFIYRLLVGNRGDVDAHGAVVFLSGIPASATVELLTPLVPPPLSSPPPEGVEEIPDVLLYGNQQVIPLIYPVIPPGETWVFSFVITLPETTSFSFRIRTMLPMFGSPMKEGWRDCFLSFITLFSNFVPMADCIMGVVQTAYELSHLAIGGEGSPGSLARTLASSALQCAEDIVPGLQVVKFVLEFGNILTSFVDVVEKCPPVDDDGNLRPIDVFGSWDPNGKWGPEGVGAARHLSPETPLGYEIDFENKPEATAPARVVVITDRLDPDVFDLSTFRFGSVLVADKFARAPEPEFSEFTADIDLRPARSVLARVSGEVDRVSGLVTWRFLSIDPATGQPPADPLGGFLPPDTDPPQGRGAVAFEVGLLPGLPTGTPVTNQATIVFDTNAPIQTPVWINTVDRTAPASQVLPAAVACPNFQITWTGSDQGSGVADYTVFLAEDGGPFTPWLEGTTATSAFFAGQAGKSYAFYSVARDAVGNVEAAPASADATVTVTLAGPSVTGISPDSGSASGGTAITIAGTGFVAGATVTVGGAAASSVTVVSPTQITATVPARPAGGLSDVVVAGAGGCAGGLSRAWFADFADVPPTHLFHNTIEKIVRAGITTGCGGGNFCPELPVTRDGMSVFILRGKNGSSFLPPPAIGNQFTDVTITTFLARWIEWFGADGITTGCGNGNYCPGSSVTRAEMAVFLLRGKLGSSFQPPNATGTVFGDVTASTFLARWMEQLKTDGITSGCGGGNFCPNGLVSRGEMAAFLARTFGL